MSEQHPTKLLLLWINGDRNAALNMVFLYAHNSRLKSWWEDVVVLVWGPSAALLADDGELRECVVKMRNDGVRVIACKACATRYGVVDKLESLGVEVFFTGEYLTEWLRSGERVLAI